MQDPLSLFAGSTEEPEIGGEGMTIPDGSTISIGEAKMSELLKFGSKEHDELLTKLIQRRNMGDKALDPRTDRWDDIDNHMKMRIDLSQKAIHADGTRSSTKFEMPFRRSVVIPVSFATLQVRTTQMLALFLQNDPPFRYEGVGPEDVDPATLLEIAVGYDLRKTQFPLVAHQAIWDAERYGLGILYDTWERDWGWQLSKPLMSKLPLPDPIMSALKTAMPGLFEWNREWKLRAEHNMYVPVDPRRFYPDPRVPLARIQEGEYIGHGTLKGYMQLLEKSEKNNGPYFNMDEVKTHCGYGKATSQKRWIDRQDQRADELDRGSYCVDHLQVRLVPAEWGLGGGNRPERWWFTWVDDTVIIRAHQSQYAHDQFTYAVGESIPDYHSLDNPGWGEQIDGIQRLINWIYNSHIEATRRAINSAMVYSPALFEESDILHPTPGGHIRLTPRAEQLLLRGQVSVQQLYSILTQTAVTQGHLQEAQFLANQVQQLSGTNDPVTGQPLPSKRTLGEIQTVLASATQRIATTMRLLDHQIFKPLAVRSGLNRQQFTELEQWFRISGDLAKELERRAASNPNFDIQGGVLRALIAPEDLVGNFDYIANTPDSPIEPAKNFELWMNFFQVVAQSMQIFASPEIASDGRIPDIREIFNETMRKAGIKNIESFYRQLPQPQAPPMPPGMPPEMAAMMGGGGPPQVVPDEQYAQQVQAGNYVSPEEMPQ